jgi:hypothetical protein
MSKCNFYFETEGEVDFISTGRRGHIVRKLKLITLYIQLLSCRRFTQEDYGYYEEHVECVCLILRLMNTPINII